MPYTRNISRYIIVLLLFGPSGILSARENEPGKQYTPDGELTLIQRYQMVTGTLRTGG